MANPAVTYTFSNSTTADATQVNTNFQDIIDSLTDGTKSLSIDALTVAGAASLNGSVTLGNGTPDDITFSGSLASSIPVKTNNSFDFGSSTIGLAGVYLGAPSSRTTRVRANQSLGASNTLTLPDGGGTAGYLFRTDGSGNLQYQLPSGLGLINLGLAGAAASNVLTISLKGANGSDPSSSNPVEIFFRNATSTTGTPVLRTCTSATSLTVSSGSTLGLASSATEYIYVYALDNAGTIELAVSADLVIDEGTVTTSTSEGGGGAADSRNVLYSTTARSNVACRLIGRMKFSTGASHASGTTWASSPTEISVLPFRKGLRHEVWVTGNGGHGGSSSGETKIRNFSTTQKNVGTAITYTARTTTTGDKFTINEDGLYAIKYIDVNAGSSFQIGITRNSSELSTDVNSVTLSTLLDLASGAANLPANCSVTLNLVSGDVIRAHDQGVTTSSSAQFRICKVND